MNVRAQVPSDFAQDMSIDAGTKSAVILSLSQGLRKMYVFPGLGTKLAEMLEEHEKHGDYSSVTSAKKFSQLLTAQMKSIVQDAHLQVFYVPQMPPSPKSAQGPRPSPRMISEVERDNFGFREVKLLRGNIGYLKVTGFPDAERGGPTVAAAMTFISHTNALIIDLRQNRGGDPGMVDLLASYFFNANPPVHLNDLSWRKAGTTEHRLQQFWTLPYVPGERYPNKKVYILVSNETPSAAEEFTYDLQALKRAIVVGEPTWGGANPGGVTPLADHFIAFIPRGEAINPVTKTNWEGKGVQPDIKVPAGSALTKAYTSALQYLITVTNDNEDMNRLKDALAQFYAGKGELE